MTSKYLRELADFADPDQLWRLSGVGQMDLSPENKKQLHAGVTLRRHARHMKQLRRLLSEKRSLLVTPLVTNSSASMGVDT